MKEGVVVAPDGVSLRFATSEFKEGKHNGSWNVMWEKHRDGHLKEPVDFLKIGHHGSINATPPPAETKGSVYDLHSSAPGTARNGKAFAEL